jgi:hypothetical protein
MAENTFNPLQDPTDDTDRDVYLDEIRRVQKARNPKFKTQNMAEAQGLLHACRENPAIRAINLKDIINNQEDVMCDELKEKLIATPDDKFVIVYISDFQLEQFKKFPYILMADGTHDVCREPYICVNLSVLDDRQEVNLCKP